MDLKDLKTQLSQQYSFRIELHAHTRPVSACSEISPKELIETYKRLGFSAVVLTNHFMYGTDAASKKEYIDSYVNAFEETEKFGNQMGIKVYFGAEIRFTENNNDYLVFGVNKKTLEDIYDYLPYGVENFRNNYPMPDSAFIQAHPMRDSAQCVDRSLLDGVEVFNMHPSHNSRIGLASLYAKENDSCIITAGSDFHHPNRNHEGLGAIRAIYLPKDSYALAKLLKKGDFLIELGRDNFVIM